MKVLFTDIDGVLNTSSTANPRKLPYVAEKKFVKRLERLVTRSRAKVVLISTWRYDPAGLFSAKRYGIPFIDVVPDLPNRARRDEIRSWLRKHPRVARFAVLDDDDDELDDLPLFQPHPRQGLTPEISRAIEAYLDGRADSDMRRNPVMRMVENVANIIGRRKG